MDDDLLSRHPITAVSIYTPAPTDGMISEEDTYKEFPQQPEGSLIPTNEGVKPISDTVERLPLPRSTVLVSALFRVRVAGLF